MCIDLVPICLTSLLALGIVIVVSDFKRNWQADEEDDEDDT